jgi:hypothetical protein
MKPFTPSVAPSLVPFSDTARLTSLAADGSNASNSLGDGAVGARFTFVPCADFPGYEVSACGRVRSVVSNWRGYGERELTQEPNDDGYPSVRLTIANKRRKRIAVHRLVARAFLGPCPDGCDQIRHLDGNPTNNRCDNLAWGNAASNAADRSEHGRAAPITPEKREKMRSGFRRWWLERNVDA